jgi:predicted nucleotidyltransferase
MKEKLIKYLRDIEQERDIKILMACETGSRAWGFPSPDSDYDVRFIYKHNNIDWYLSLSEKKDTIELFLEDNELDFSGWELRKSLKLLYKSNASLLEKIQSPIIYMADDEFLKGINELANKCYSKNAVLHHYLSMAKNFLFEIDVNNYKLKKLFYALRAATACNWILEKEQIPPIQFYPVMLEGLNIDIGLKKRIETLINLKASVSETYYHNNETEILEFINKNIESAEANGYSFPGNKKNIDLDDFFLSLVRK